MDITAHAHHHASKRPIAVVSGLGGAQAVGTAVDLDLSGDVEAVTV